MDPIQLMITSVGLDALVNAQSGSTEQVEIGAVGLTSAPFIMSPTLTALPGEFKRITAVSGQSISETVIHMTAQDVSADVYDLRGLGLYLTDGRLFAVYSQADPIFRKVSIAFFLIALDIAFANGVAGDIVFGDTSFLMPPASETVQGVAEIATPAEAAAGTDHERFITPKTAKMLDDVVKQIAADALAAVNTAIRADLAFGDNYLAGLITALDAALTGDIAALDADLTGRLAALIARTITGGGLVTGGGNLSDSRVLSVMAADAADVLNGTALDRAITPAALSGLPRDLGPDGYVVLPGTGGLMLQWGAVMVAASAVSPLTCSFVASFPNAAFRVFAGCEQTMDDGDESDEPLLAYPLDQSTFALAFSGDRLSANVAWWAIGK